MLTEAGASRKAEEPTPVHPPEFCSQHARQTGQGGLVFGLHASLSKTTMTRRSVVSSTEKATMLI